MILIAAIDVPFQVWDHAKQLKMSRKEIKDEMKETDGNPELKAKIRQQQQEVASRRMMEAVPGADVIIVNPTHYAVALKYDADSMSAPVVVAKGVDFMAAHIRDIGAAHGVTQVRSPLLAQQSSTTLSWMTRFPQPCSRQWRKSLPMFSGYELVRRLTKIPRASSISTFPLR